MNKWVVWLCCLLIFSAGCVPQPAVPAPTSLPSPAEVAQETLVRFLTHLHEGRYESAASLYFGEYESLQVFNPEITPADHAALWKWACENQLLQCLAVRSSALASQRDGIYLFQVEFSNPDGSLFVRGPCCGADETEMPPVSQFEYRVMHTPEGKFLVLDTPPYVP